MKRFAFSLVILLILAVFCPVILAQDPVTTTETVKEATDPSGWLETLLGNEAIFGAIVSGVLLLWGILKAKLHLKDTKWAKVLETVEQAVAEVYHEYIRDLKTGRADGKLTKEEIDEAHKKAWERAKTIGKEKGLDVAKEVSQAYFPVLIKKVLGKISK